MPPFVDGALIFPTRTGFHHEAFLNDGPLPDTWWRGANELENTNERPALSGNTLTMETKSDRNAVLRVLCLSFFLVPFMGSSLNLALPGIVDDFGLSAYFLTFLFSTYLVSTAIFQMPAARIADLLGRRKMYLAGLAIFAVFALLGGVAWSGTALLLCRIFSGVGSAILFATGLTLLVAVFPKGESGKALGINTAVVYTSTSAGPFLGGLMTQYLGWRSIFFLSFAVAAATFILAARYIKDEWIVAKGESFDYKTASAYAVSLAGLIFGFSLLPGLLGWVLLAGGGLVLLLFIHLDHRSAYPLVKLDLFSQNRVFRLSALSSMINYASSFAIGFMMSLYLQYGKGMDPGRAGMVIMVQPISQALLSPLAGRVSDRMDPSILTTAGMSVTTFGLLTLSFVAPDTSLVWIVVTLAVIGASFAVFSAPNSNLIMGSVSRRDSGAASATIGTARLIGQSLSIAIASLVVHHHIGTAQLTRDSNAQLMPIVHSAFLIFAAICAVGVYASAHKLKGGKGREWKHVSVRRTADDGNADN